MTQTRYSDPKLLRTLCIAELVGKPVVAIRWLGFSDQIGIASGYDKDGKPKIALDQIDWILMDKSTNEILASYDQPFKKYRTVIESLVGSRYVDIDISPSFAPTFYFDNGMVLVGGDCIDPEAAEDDTCWELFCKDGFVLVIGVGKSEWVKQRADINYG
jgi:hypothetical protein